MASLAELSLDCKPPGYSMLLKSFGVQIDQTYKLEEFLSHLEEERLKIDAFKRELPLCMQLLTNAMEASRQQLHAFRSNQSTKPVLEEFIPTEHSNSQENNEKASTISQISDKANWMTSTKLWSQASEGTKPQSSITSPQEANIRFMSISPKQRNGGAFLPFSKERSASNQGSTILKAVPKLQLVSKEMEEKKCAEPEMGLSCSKRENSSKGGNDGGAVDQGKGGTVESETQANTTSTTSQTHRKARRCWSPDLHRRFVNALQMLGGSQVATPKQIRDLMKVDGLTNDEVKSHLQKYRLHTRRPSPSLQTGAPAPQLVVLGGIWVPPEYATAPAVYGQHHTSHAPPPHYYAANPQEFYNPAPPQSPLPPLPHHQHLHMFKTAPHTQSSPESEAPGCGDRSESIEDGNSDSSSLEGENERERKGLISLRGEEGEDSTGSEITLKF